MTSVINRLANAANGSRKHMHRLTVSVETITPATAVRWMAEHHDDNRPLKKTHVTYLARAMRNGEWMLNGESVVFDWNGKIRNGQHRLSACIESGLSFETVVVRGVDPAAFATMDGGSKRTVGDHMAVMGKQHYNLLAAAVSELRRWERGDLGATSSEDKRVSGVEAVEVLARYPDIENSVAIGQRCKPVMSTGIATFFHYVFSQKDRKAADEFFAAIADGVGLSKTQAVWHLRERLITVKTDRTKYLTPRHMKALVIKAWNATREGRPVKSLKFSPDAGEAFPEIL